MIAASHYGGKRTRCVMTLQFQSARRSFNYARVNYDPLETSLNPDNVLFSCVMFHARTLKGREESQGQILKPVSSFCSFLGLGGSGWPFASCVEQQDSPNCLGGSNTKPQLLPYGRRTKRINLQTVRGADLERESVTIIVGAMLASTPVISDPASAHRAAFGPPAREMLSWALGRP